MTIGIVIKFIALLMICLIIAFVSGGIIAMIDMDLKTNKDKD